MNQKKTKDPAKRSRGAILLLTTILLFVILGMVVSLSYITVMEQKMSGKTKSSVASFYNSESGVEWALNKIATKSGDSDISTMGTFDGNAVKCPASFGSDTCKVLFLDKDGNVLPTIAKISEIEAVRSVGTQGGETQRAIEAAVAAGSLNCVIKQGAESGAGDDSESQVICEAGYSLTGCSCYSSTATYCDGSKPSSTVSNECIAYKSSAGGSGGVFAEAICCKIN